MYLHIPIHRNIVENTGEYMFDTGMRGRNFFFFFCHKSSGGHHEKKIHILHYVFKKLFILAALNLHCCSWAFSSCGNRGYSLAVVLGLLIAVASLAAEHRL